MNSSNYKRAIQKKETIDFLLGNGEYHYPDIEWHPDLHIGRYTFEQIRDYGRIYGGEKMMRQFVKDLKKSLKLNLNSFEFLLISTYIYIYIRDYYEKKILTSLHLDEETIELIKYHYYNFIKIYDATDINFKSEYDLLKKYGYKKDNIENNTQNISIIEANMNFFINNIIAKYNFIKERFGIDLLS